MRRFGDEDWTPDPREAGHGHPLSVVGWALFVPSVCLVIVALILVYW